MDILNMITDIHYEINELRQLENYLKSDEFSVMLDTVKHSINDVDQIKLYIKTRDLIGLKDYVRSKQSLDNYSVKELRQIARTLHVDGYNNISKYQLIEEIKRCRMRETQLQQLKSYMTT